MYMKSHYDITGFVNCNFGRDPNAVSRLRNLMATTLEGQILFPKFIVLVADDDIIKCLNHSGYGISKNLGRLVNNIMGYYSRIIETYKEYLPNKSKRQDYPHIIWIEAPLHEAFHNNEERGKFNSCLLEMGKLHQNVSVLKLKKIWDPLDKMLYTTDQRRFTSEGYNKYWEAVDKTVKYCDTILLKKISKKKETPHNLVGKKFSNAGNNQFRWRREESSNSDNRSDNVTKMIPKTKGVHYRHHQHIRNVNIAEATIPPVNASWTDHHVTETATGNMTIFPEKEVQADLAINP